MSRRYICIHGHFYQPPRENAWLEAVELQESAAPAHDWNERITRECYATNARARLLNARGRIERAVSTYSRISFNMGPTLLAWMLDAAPSVYRRIIQSDRDSAERFGGHGSALAQAYNHSILPLCNERDRHTQILWGIADFKARFGRDPEGMWLPETAVSTPVLESLAECGIRFTILAPRQCASVRPFGHSGDDGWNPVGEGVDPTQPYLCRLPSGRSIALFFYDGPVSQGVAFEGLLNSGDRFASRLMEGFHADRGHDQLMHIATDGESYGHHHRHGEMALAAALDRLERDPSVQLINYGQYLELHPPRMEARIRENSSWSCVHGVERWRSDCGCNSGKAGFHQKWRAPLRHALDWLRDQIAPRFEAVSRGATSGSPGAVASGGGTGTATFADPWGARDAYISVILDRSPESRDRFLRAHAAPNLSPAGQTQALRLMELQRHAMLMYTSCAWFFDDVAGIETVQVIQYAARVIQLARSSLGLDLEPAFLEHLQKAEGSKRDLPNARRVYEEQVRPAMVSLERVAAHYALGRLFDPPSSRVYAYDVLDDTGERVTSGRARLAIGHATFRSRIDLDSARLAFCALHVGDHTTTCSVAPFPSSEVFESARAEAEAAFARADFTGVQRVMDRAFVAPSGTSTAYSIASLFRDRQHAVVRRILEPVLEQVDSAYRQIYEQHAPLARFLRSLDLTIPRRIGAIATFVLSQAMRRALEQPVPNIQWAGEVAREAAGAGISLDEQTVGRAALDAIRNAISEPVPAAAAEAPGVADQARRILELHAFIRTLPIVIDTWPLQEHFLDHLRPRLQLLRARADDAARAEAALLVQLGEALEIEV
ncbi:MAG: DUF3536 domain-containing protein [Phycisphaerales bacterium]